MLSMVAGTVSASWALLGGDILLVAKVFLNRV